MTALAVAVGWIVGAAAGLTFAGDVGVYAIGGGVVALVAAWRGVAGLVRGVALVVAATLFGVARVAFGGMPMPPEALSGVAGPVTLAGRVVEAPTPRGGRLDVTLALTRIERPPTARVVDPGAPPRVLVRGIDSEVRYGDLLVVGGRLEAPRSRPGYPLAELLAR